MYFTLIKIVFSISFTIKRRLFARKEWLVNPRWKSNLKTNKQMLPVPNWLLDCVIFLLF
jgi:hypothetical protein